MLITSISAANPTVVTVAGHNAVTGQVVALDSTNSTPALSGDYVATVLTANTFSVPVNVTGAGNAGNAYPVLFCDYESGVNANSGITYDLRFKDLTNGATAARLFPGYQVRMKASPDATSLGQTATWTDGPLPATFGPTSGTPTTPVVITKANHGLNTDDTVIINSYGGNNNSTTNGVWNITVSGDTFTLFNADGSNSSSTTSSPSNGTVRKITNSVVRLSTAVTKNIANYGNLKYLWTPSVNVTTANHALYKEGRFSSQIVIATGFTTGLAAYYPTGTLDLSEYQQVSFWIYQLSGALGAESSCSLVLCSDAAGETVVNTINIPALGALVRWSPITVDLGSALGSSIQSIAFIVNTDNGAQTFLLDNIIACKASSAADSLSLTSLIGKNTGTEGWYGIQSINGTRVVLDMDTNCVPAANPSRGYSGTTETVTTWKQEITKTDMSALSATQVQAITKAGTVDNPITFSGGWNRTDMSTQTGETLFDGQNGLGYGIRIFFAFINMESVSACRYNNGFISAASRLNLNVPNANNNGNSGIFCQSVNSVLNVTNANNNSNMGIYATTNCEVNAINVNNNAANAFQFASLNIRGKIQSCKNSGSADIRNDSGPNYLINSSLLSAVKIDHNAGFLNNTVWSTNENNNTDTHFGYTDGGLISSDITTVHTAGGMSWKLSPTSTNRSASYPLPLKVATGATPANTPITCNVWFRRDNTGITARLICKGGQLTGQDADVITYMTADANVWEMLSVSATPSQKGVLEFTAEAFGGTTYNCWTTEASFT